MLGSFWFLGLLVIASVALSLAGLLIVRRFIDNKELEAHHGVSGYMLTIIGTLYAVVLGFIVVGSLNTFQNASLTVAHEANSLHDVFHLAQGLPDGLGNDIRQPCLQYAKDMVTKEWPAMQGGRGSPSTHITMERL